MYYDLIIIDLVIVRAHELHCKHHTRMTINKINFNKLKQDTWKCDWLIGHVISINIKCIRTLVWKLVVIDYQVYIILCLLMTDE